jgi:hypothetical protein
MFIVTLSSSLLLSMMMFGTEGYEVGRPRRRSLVTVSLLTPEERKTPHFQEDFFRGLQEITSYSYSYSNAPKAPPQPCNQTEVVDNNATLDLASANQTEVSSNVTLDLAPANQTEMSSHATLDLAPANQTEMSSSRTQVTPLNGTSDGAIQNGSAVIAKETLARSPAVSNEIVTKPASSKIAVGVGVGVGLLLVAFVSAFFAHRRYKKNVNEADAVV